MGRKKIPNTRSKQKYRENIIRQNRIGVQWNLSWEDWHEFWLANGIDKNVSRADYSKGSLVLTRIDETRPFELGNIRVMTRGTTATGIPCRTLGKQRPNTWVIKDPVLHEMYLPFLRSRSQAWYLKQDWELTFEDFVAVWGTKWAERGRASDNYSMARIDTDLGWTVDNVTLMTRGDYRRLYGSKNSLTGRSRVKL